MQQGYAEFYALLVSGAATALDSGASFSICLANAAGVWTEEESQRVQAQQLEVGAEPSEDATSSSQTEDSDQAPNSEEEVIDNGEAEVEIEAVIAPEAHEAESFSKEPEDLVVEVEPAAPETEIIIPMGTWLGFHDGDAPLMAKLAVHDLEQDSYIFVNREGIKMRSLNMHELITLMDNDQVDILEARSNFRSEVTRVKKQHD